MTDDDLQLWRPTRLLNPGPGNKTGAFVRVQRDGKWTNVDIANCTREELVSLFARSLERGDAGVLLGWAVFLAEWIRDHKQDGS